MLFFTSAVHIIITKTLTTPLGFWPAHHHRFYTCCKFNDNHTVKHNAKSLMTRDLMVTSIINKFEKELMCFTNKIPKDYFNTF